MDEARRSGGFAIYAYAIMPDHIHIITGSALKPSDTLRYLKGIISRRVIGYLKENNFFESLRKLRKGEEWRSYKHTLWEHHSNTYFITSEQALMQKANYIHRNPVADGVCEKMENYLYSSARYWLKRPVENEPLWVDIKEIDWYGA
jgi:REP element-mobilizing transposase RayT